MQTHSSNAIIAVVSNGTTALAYYWITYQLLAFAGSSKLYKLTDVLRLNKDRKKRYLFYMLLAVAVLFASFITLCGTTHAVHVLTYYYPSSHGLSILWHFMHVFCAAVSVVTAIITWRLFPVILQSLEKFELNSEGNLQHAENYMIEVVEMVKESILVLSDDFQIVRCNQAANVLLGAADCMGMNYTASIHPNDLKLFHACVNRVMHGFASESSTATIEYRINKFAAAGHSVKPTQPTIPENNARNMKVLPTSSDGPSISTRRENISTQNTGIVGLSFSAESCRSVSGSDHSIMTAALAAASADAENYIWVESTICKGVRLNREEDFVYEIKLVTRNIEDRKREAVREYNEIIRETEERDRTNAAKLRYISCIAHDLKTPLQSFCFTLDLLNQTNMHREQREYVQQANVAVDLMKLTISQTMDISKALTGAKLMPRRSTVYLSSIMHRVEIIISGYGKQVPVSFEIAQNVNDRIITDEEWLWQMILNLLTNACKYTDRGEIYVKLSRQSGIANSTIINETEMLLIEVVDTGVGVSDEKIGSIFDAFAQVQEGQVTGTGLGLFGVRTRAEGLQGTCGARHNTESSTGTGTVLWFAIPYVPDTSQPNSPGGHARAVAYKRVLGFQRAPSAADVGHPLEASEDGALTAISEGDQKIEAQIRARKLTALVIDDTKTVRKLMEKLLLKMGFESVQCYENGSKGLEAMVAGQVDIVFSDVQMPIMTGPEMVRRFRKFELEALESGAREVRQLVVAVTANGSELTDSVNNGFDEVCPKPLSVQNIYTLVKKFFVLN